MQARLRRWWPYALALFIVYLLPQAGIWVLQLSGNPDVATAWKGWALTCLLGVNPLAVVAVSVLYGLRHKFEFLFALLTGALWIPAALTLYNETAMIYLLFYVVFSFGGMALGNILARSAKAKTAAS